MRTPARRPPVNHRSAAEALTRRLLEDQFALEALAVDCLSAVPFYARALTPKGCVFVKENPWYLSDTEFAASLAIQSAFFEAGAPTCTPWVPRRKLDRSSCSSVSRASSSATGVEASEVSVQRPKCTRASKGRPRGDDPRERSSSGRPTRSLASRARESHPARSSVPLDIRNPAAPVPPDLRALCAFDRRQPALTWRQSQGETGFSITIQGPHATS